MHAIWLVGEHTMFRVVVIFKTRTVSSRHLHLQSSPVLLHLLSSLWCIQYFEGVARKWQNDDKDIASDDMKATSSHTNLLQLQLQPVGLLLHERCFMHPPLQLLLRISCLPLLSIIISSNTSPININIQTFASFSAFSRSAANSACFLASSALFWASNSCCLDFSPSFIFSSSDRAVWLDLSNSTSSQWYYIRV